MSKKGRPAVAPDGTRYPSVRAMLRATGIDMADFYRRLGRWDNEAGVYRVSHMPALRTRKGGFPRRPPTPPVFVPHDELVRRMQRREAQS